MTLVEARASGVTHNAFGDLFLVDVRVYRVRLPEGKGIEPHFPIWPTEQGSPALTRTMLATGPGAVLPCVDPNRLSERSAVRGGAPG